MVREREREKRETQIQFVVRCIEKESLEIFGEKICKKTSAITVDDDDDDDDVDIVKKL